MTLLPRSVYGFGDPVHDRLAREEQTDHYRARARGQRLLLIADGIVSRLDWRLPDPIMARGEIFHALADSLYPSDAAIALPNFRDEKSLDAMRRGRVG
jgi:hypothetical protein